MWWRGVPCTLGHLQAATHALAPFRLPALIESTRAPPLLLCCALAEGKLVLPTQCVSDKECGQYLLLLFYVMEKT